MMKTLSLLSTGALSGLCAFSLLCLPAAADPLKDTGPLLDKEWVLQNLKLDGKGIELPVGKPMTLKVDAEGKASGRSAVNRYFGQLALDGKGGCSWGRGMGATRMAGPPAMMEIEQGFFQALPKTTTVDLAADVLTFSSADGQTAAVFGLDAGADAFIEGQVVFKADPTGKIPDGAKVRVTLQDVSLADAAATQLGSITIPDTQAFPVKFKIPYASTAVQKGRRYTVSARIEDATGLRYINDTAHPVLEDGTPPTEPVELVVIKVK